MLSTELKYGSDMYWHSTNECKVGHAIPIYRVNTVIANANDKYEAKLIVDSLNKYATMDCADKLGKKETVFLEFVMVNCNEPYVTMASNALLWNDRSTYNKLKSEFDVMYE